MRNRLRVLRTEWTWTQAELAGRVGVSLQTINTIETGKYESSLGLAFKLAHLFGLAVEGVFELEAEVLQEVDKE